MTKLFRPEELRLSNGIPVVLQHYDGPVAATYWWVRAGSADEAPSEAGFAHFLEHMLFKDAAAKETGRASTGKMARAVESLGGDINAYTSFDQTVYHVTCASTHWERVIDAFGTMAKPQRFLKADFLREREVILEELRKNQDSPERQLFQSLFGATYRKHPYGRPVIGTVKSLKAATVGTLEAFYRRNYVSGNMGLVLVGPIEGADSPRRKALLRLLEKKFGSAVLPARKAGVRARIQEPQLRSAPAFVTKAFDVKAPSLGFSFRVPDLLHADIPALDLLSGILGMGELSRLYQKLFYQSSLATEVSGGLYVPRDPGMLYFQAEVADSSRIQPAVEALLGELGRLRSEGPTPEELDRVVVNAESERLYATQTADGMAGRLGFLRFVLGNLDFDENYLAQLRAVDGDAVRDIARQYLDYRRMSAVILTPKEEPVFATAAADELARATLVPEQAKFDRMGARKRKGKSDLTENPVELIRLPSGLQVAYFHRPQSQVFSIHCSVLGGLRLELAHPIRSAAEDWGASSMLALTWAKGTRTRDAREISRVVEGHAAGMDGFSGRNSVGVHLTGLARDWTVLSELLAEVLLEPSFADEEVEHSRRVTEDSIRSIEDHSAQLCSRLFLETLFERHPYGKNTHGSLQSVAGIDRERLLAFHRLWVRPERLVLSLSGSVKRAQLEAWLAEFDQRAVALAASYPGVSLPKGLENETDLKAPRWVERVMGREQCHILVGGLGTTVGSEDRHAFRLLQTILGGQSGRLFIELREKKSLAYSVAPVSFEGLERGYAGTYIASAIEKRQEALAGIRKVLEQLAETGPTPAEMARAKEFYLGRRAMDLQSDSALAAHHGLETLYQVPRLSEGELVRKIRAIGPREVKEVCRRYLVEPHMVTGVVG